MKQNKNTEGPYGLVINWNFHKKNKWVSALSPYLVNAIVKEFNPIIISNQFTYFRHKNKLKYIISMEPGWAAPYIKYDIKIDAKKAVFYSDPHYKPKERFEYFNLNGFNYVFSYYNNPFFYHFKKFPKRKFVHLPWAVPDEFLSYHDLIPQNDDVIIFGGKNSPAYDVRNWCRDQPYIINYHNSGVENKKMSDAEYFQWLTNFNAVVAAGSSDPKFDLVTPKYFEIASSGALLICQYCKDLDDLGFDNKNSIIFTTKEELLDKIFKYKNNPESYIHIRKAGRKLIRDKHKISDRIRRIKAILQK